MMQTSGGAEAEAAILSAERRFFIDLKFDWDGDGTYDHYLTDLSRFTSSAIVDRQLAGSAPQELMLIEGASAAQLTVVIGGEDFLDQGLNFVGVFSPYNGFSSLYNLNPMGVEVKYRLGVETVLGVVWYDQFVGNVRTITPNREDNSVTITALDRVEKLRVPVRFPTWSIHSYWSDRGWAVAQLADSHWVIDHCLRNANISPTPNLPVYGYPEDLGWNGNVQDQGTQFYLSGNGSHVPSIGWVDQSRRQGYPKSETGRAMYAAVGEKHPDSQAETPPLALAAMANDASGYGGFDEGLDFYSSVSSTAELRYWAQDRVNQPGNGTYWFGFTLHKNGVSGDWWRTNTSYVGDFFIGYNRVVRLVLSLGSFRVEVRNRLGVAPFTGAVTSWKAVPNVDHVKIDVVVNGSDQNNTRVWTNINGTVSNDENIGAVLWNTTNFDDHQGLIILRHHAAISDVYWVTRWFTLSGTMPNLAHYAQGTAEFVAELDQGLNELTHMPSTIYEDAWQVITDVAAAEFGSVFWDEFGVFHFWNRDTLLAKQDDIVRAMNIDDVTGLQITNSLDSVRNIVTASSKLKSSDDNVVFASSNPDEILAPALTVSRAFSLYIEGVESVEPNKLTRHSTIPGSAFPLWEDVGSKRGYVVQFKDSVTGVWEEDDGKTSGVDILAQLDENGKLVLYIWNGYTEDARFATNDGQAALQVTGTAQFDKGEVPLVAKDDDSINKYGPRNLSVSNDWTQWQPSSITQLVEYLLPRTVESIPTTDAIVIPGDPRLQLGDCISISDPNGLGEEIRLQIYGISREYSRDNGLTDTLSVEMLRPAGVGVWDSAQYGIWDQTFTWSD